MASFATEIISIYQLQYFTTNIQPPVMFRPVGSFQYHLFKLVLMIIILEVLIALSCKMKVPMILQ